MPLDKDEKESLRDSARPEGWDAGVEAGEKAADALDREIYTAYLNSDETTVYAAEYKESHLEAFERSFRRRWRQHQMRRFDDRMNAKRKENQS